MLELRFSHAAFDAPLLHLTPPVEKLTVVSPDWLETKDAELKRTRENTAKTREIKIIAFTSFFMFY
jgi:hypothetical protein